MGILAVFMLLDPSRGPQLGAGSCSPTPESEERGPVLYLKQASVSLLTHCYGVLPESPEKQRLHAAWLAEDKQGLSEERHCLRASIAVIKYHNPKHLGEERVYFLDFLVTFHH